MHKRNYLALAIAVLYVGFATLGLFSIYPSDFFYGEFTLLGLLIGFPVDIISFGYRYADSETLLPVFIIQASMVIPVYFFVRGRLKRKSRRYKYSPRLRMK